MACLSFLFDASAQSQNLVPNPGFDVDLTGWIIQEGSAFWSGLDAGGSAFSGSLFATPPAGGSAGVRSGCFPASPGAYELAYKHLEPENDAPGMAVFLRWYRDADCTSLLGNSISFGGALHGPFFQTISSRAVGVDIIAPHGTQSAALQISTLAKAYFDDVVVLRLGSCTSDTCLHDGRFAVTVRFTAGTHSGQGRPLQVTSDSAFFWFFDTANVELVVKVLDGCPLNDRFWVFMAGLTDVRVEVTVTDVATGATWTYLNPQGQPFPPVQDTSALATCL